MTDITFCLVICCKVIEAASIFLPLLMAMTFYKVTQLTKKGSSCSYFPYLKLCNTHYSHFLNNPDKSCLQTGLSEVCPITFNNSPSIDFVYFLLAAPIRVNDIDSKRSSAISESDSEYRYSFPILKQSTFFPDS